MGLKFFDSEFEFKFDNLGVDTCLVIPTLSALLITDIGVRGVRGVLGVDVLGVFGVSGALIFNITSLFTLPLVLC